MKFVLFVLAILVLLWLLKRTLGRQRPPSAPRPGAAPDARTDAPGAPLVACALCGVHLPRHESLPGRGGVFCGEAHRSEYEQKHPVP